MRRRINQFISLILLFFMMSFNGLSIAAADVKPSSGILWQTWSNNAFEQAKAKKDRVFLYIKADWCHWCQLMGDITLHDINVIKVINENYIPIKLDIDKDIDIARQFRATSFPTMIILNSHKKIIKRFSGYVSPEMMVKNLTPTS